MEQEGAERQNSLLQVPTLSLLASIVGLCWEDLFKEVYAGTTYESVKHYSI